MKENNIVCRSRKSECYAKRQQKNAVNHYSTVDKYRSEREDLCELFGIKRLDTSRMLRTF